MDSWYYTVLQDIQVVEEDGNLSVFFLLPAESVIDHTLKFCVI